MENPLTWGPAEKTVARALAEAEIGRDKGVVGLSVVRQVTDALREAGLLLESTSETDDEETATDQP